MSKSIEERFGAEKLLEAALKDFEAHWQRFYPGIDLKGAPDAEKAKALYAWLEPQAAAYTEEELRALREERIIGPGWEARISPTAFILASHAAEHSFLGPLLKYREGNCVAYTALFVAMARRLGLKAGAADIIRDLRGHDVMGRHVCPFVEIAGRRILMDPMYKAMVARHKEWRAVSDDRLHASAWSNKGNALSKLGRHAEALKAFEKALKIDPQHELAWNDKGTALSKLGRYAEALKAYEKALEINPLHAWAWNNKGNALTSLGRYTEALKAYDKALEINPLDPAPWHNKGVIYQRLGEHAQAEQCFRKAKQLGLEKPLK